MPDALAVIRPHLTYHWTLACVALQEQSGRLAVGFPERRLEALWLPALWFVKGVYAGQPMYDRFWMRVEDGTRDIPGWRENEPVVGQLIVRLTETGGVVLDPYMGTGAVGAPAMRLGRRFIGIERDVKHLARAAERLASPSQRSGELPPR